MATVSKVSLNHRKWAEDGRRYVEPVLRIHRDDDTTLDYIFCYAKFGEPLVIEPGVFAMINRQFVWSSVRSATVVERYVIDIQVGKQEPQVFQSFRLFPIVRGQKARPSHWMWNIGPIEEPFLSEREADEPSTSRRRWMRGPEEKCVILRADEEARPHA